MVNYGDRPKLSKWLFWRADSPFIWYQFVLTIDGEKQKFNGSTETSDKKLAENIVNKLRSDALGGTIRKKKTKIRIEKMLDEYVDACRRQPSFPIKGFIRNTLLAHKHFAGKMAHEVTRRDCLDYRLDRATEVKESTVNHELGMLRNAYNVAIRDFGYVLENPVTKIPFYRTKKFERKRFMLQDEQALFFSDPQLALEAKELYMFAIKSGLRQGEIRDLKWADIDMKNNVILVRAGDEDSNRFVPMHMYVQQILDRKRAAGEPSRSSYVFPNGDGDKQTKDGWISSSFDTACKRLGIENLHFHDLRHTFASELVMAGVDFKTLGIYLGHSTQAMTDRYAHLSPKYQAAQIMLMPRLPAFEAALSHYVGATLSNDAITKKTDKEKTHGNF